MPVVTVNLEANGQRIDRGYIRDADGSKYTFDNLYKYEDGKEIVYSITEEPLDSFHRV